MCAKNQSDSRVLPPNVCFSFPQLNVRVPELQDAGTVNSTTEQRQGQRVEIVGYHAITDVQLKAVVATELLNIRTNIPFSIKGRKLPSFLPYEITLHWLTKKYILPRNTAKIFQYNPIRFRSDIKALYIKHFCIISPFNLETKYPLVFALISIM